MAVNMPLLDGRRESCNSKTNSSNCSYCCLFLPCETTVIVHFSSKQLLLFAFGLHCEVSIYCCLSCSVDERQTTVTPYFSSHQLLLFALTRHRPLPVLTELWIITIKCGGNHFSLLVIYVPETPTWYLQTVHKKPAVWLIWLRGSHGDLLRSSDAERWNSFTFGSGCIYLSVTCRPTLCFYSLIYFLIKVYYLSGRQSVWFFPVRFDQGVLSIR